MPTVIHELADAFLRRKQAMSEGKRAKSVLPGSDYFMPKSAKEDLNNRLSVFEQGGLPELLKQAGKEMYDNPIVNTAIGFTPVVGDIQAAGETMAALNRGAPWQETAGYAAGMLPFVPMIGKTVWHGSPHTFDKFDLSKIGTGEGAQAYGHGLYFAESPGVATSYKEGLTNKARPSNISTGYENAAWIQARNAPDMPTEKLIPYVKQAYPNIADADIASAIEKSKESLQQGSLYKVDLPDEQIAKMLDWDIRLSEQSNPALQEWFAAQKTYPGGYAFNEHTGETLYKALIGRGMTPAEASAELKQAGIPGIQYLDQASRGAGEGTRNYVVFSDEIPKILERNGTSVFEFPKD